MCCYFLFSLLKTIVLLNILWKSDLKDSEASEVGLQEPGIGKVRYMSHCLADSTIYVWTGGLMGTT